MGTSPVYFGVMELVSLGHCYKFEYAPILTYILAGSGKTVLA